MLIAYCIFLLLYCTLYLLYYIIAYNFVIIMIMISWPPVGRTHLFLFSFVIYLFVYFLVIDLRQGAYIIYHKIFVFLFYVSVLVSVERS